MATADDEAIFAAIGDPIRATDNLLLDLSIGRFYAGGKFWFLAKIQALAFGNPWMLGFTRASFILLPALAAWQLFGKLLKNAEIGALVALLWVATYSVFPGYQPLFSNPLLLLGLTSTLLACSAAIQAEVSTQPVRWRVLSLVLFTAALLMHEVFVVFVAAILWTITASNQGTACRLAKMIFFAPYLLVIVVYAALFFLLRHRAAELGIQYAGTTLSTEPMAAFQALCRYTLAALPGFEIFFKRTAELTALPIYAPSEILQRVALNLRLLDFGVAALAGFGAAVLAIRLSTMAPPRRTLLFVCTGIALVFLPNLLIALTPKYQVWMHQRRFPYYYGGLGFPFFWLSVGLCLWQRFAALRTRQPRMLPAAVVALGAAVATSSIAITAVNRDAILHLIAQPFR